MSASEKSRIQTACAIAEGTRNTKSVTQAKFTAEVKLQEKYGVGNDSHLGIAQNIGKRGRMEDTHSFKSFDIQTDDDTVSVDLLGIYDGHGGREAAEYVRDHIVEKLQQKLEAAPDLEHETVCDLLTLIMIELEKEFLAADSIPKECGTCLTCAIQIENTIYFPNIGDSRTILVKPDTYYQLTEDDENARFDQKGNERFLKHLNQPVHLSQSDLRNNANMGVTRNIGMDQLSCRPKISYIQLRDQEDDPENGYIFFQEEADQYVIMGCDGLWDVATNQEAADIVRELHKKGATCQEIANALLQAALNASKGGIRLGGPFEYVADNITIIVTKL